MSFRWFLIVVFCGLLFAQETVPAGDDIDKIISEIEGQKVTDEDLVIEVFEHPFKPTDSREQSLFDEVVGYWQAAHTANWGQVYTFFWQPFRDNMPVESYVKAEKAAIKSYKISSIRFVSDSCAQVVVSYSLEHPMMNLSNIPTKQNWHLENDHWRIMADPFENMMGIKPPNTPAMPKPCDFSSLYTQPVHKKRPQNDD
ncbi:MAG: hypothetical protein KDC35_15495 [Acidobacteria bacterium]|nr:hypothetical protein [Acidobacteriota bacterium]